MPGKIIEHKDSLYSSHVLSTLLHCTRHDMFFLHTGTSRCRHSFLPSPQHQVHWTAHKGPKQTVILRGQYVAPTWSCVCLLSATRLRYINLTVMLVCLIQGTKTMQIKSALTQHSLENDPRASRPDDLMLHSHGFRQTADGQCPVVRGHNETCMIVSCYIDI